jgi:uncharacterized protein YecA (UPF0149 family)
MARAEKLGLSFNVYVARAIEAYGAWKPPLGMPPGAKVIASGVVPSRNSPCICGSGKKYKRCCG